MKTPTKILAAALFGITLNVGAIAGPGIQYWQNHGAASKSTADITAAKMADASKGMACSTMTEPKARISREDSATTRIVTCTPELLKNNPRCQQACGM